MKNYYDMPVWIFCLCDAGLNAMEKHRLVLPRPTRDQMAALRRRDFPLSHFVPSPEEVRKVGGMTAFSKWQEWQKELKLSEKFWKQMQETQ